MTIGANLDEFTRASNKPSGHSYYVTSSAGFFCWDLLWLHSDASSISFGWLNLLALVLVLARNFRFATSERAHPVNKSN